MRSLNKTNMLHALKRLDELVLRPFEMIIGGGAAMLYVYGSPLKTWDIDAVLKHTTLEDIQKSVHLVAEEMSLPKNWLNSWYSSFTHTLPADFSDRLKTLFKGKHIKAFAFGPEDMLILKCCAHRGKDVSHARILVKQADTDFVMKHLDNLYDKKLIPSTRAMEFLEDLLEHKL